MSLSVPERNAIDAATARVEARTGVQVVTALVGKADHYAELPWIAFALGASIAALGAVVADWLRPQWMSAEVALVHTITILGFGAASALAAVLLPAYARIFLRDTRRDVEVRHYAESMFLRRELFRTQARNTVLILVCRFERKVEILPDVGLHGVVSETDWQRVIAAMTQPLREERFGDALRAGLAALEAMLADKGLAAHEGKRNELPERPIEEDGAA
ncbi:MAG TPA: TPM domain-containing protein [Casimicrobiaceae bacterium]|nr:TPM domain-containing protein [Casimicrobiaceae bacterium]